jgi:hypothetical protein
MLPGLVYGCVMGVQVCGLERRLCDCWEALHDVDVRVELLHNRSVTRVTGPSLVYVCNRS